MRGETRQRSSAAVGRCYPEPVLQQMAFADALQKKRLHDDTSQKKKKTLRIQIKWFN